MDIKQRFTQSIITAMKRDVKEAAGNEVFWVGKINSNGLVVSVKVGARGNEDSVVVNQGLAKEGNVLIHNHPSGILYPSEADQSIAYNANDSSLGFYIVDNNISDVYVVVEPILPKVYKKINLEEAARYISKNGEFARQNENYEERPSQIELLKKICESFNENKIGVFEAGTGVGKSFAYLIPSILWAVQNKERVVISTGTINLQQQLIEKDIPVAQKILGQEIKSILLKGRQNYICLRRLKDASNERDLFSEETEIFDSIYEWSKNTSTGSKSDLSFVPPDNIWSRINSESDACMGGKCPNREQCFVMKLRKEAADASLIVVNHHLLFADIESRMNGVGYDEVAVLPPYSRLVFDEAHGIEDSATSFFSESINRFKILKQLNLLFRRKRSSVNGLIANVGVISNMDDPITAAEELIEKVKTDLILAEQVAGDAMDNSSTARITDENSFVYSSVIHQILELRNSINKLYEFIQELICEVPDDMKDFPPLWELKAVARRLEDMLVLCGTYSEWDQHADKVFWMQKHKLPGAKFKSDDTLFVEFNQTPLNIAPLMNMGVFEPMSTVICTSATLRTGTTFDYWFNRTGINFVENERLLKGVFESPFPYSTNMIFAVTRDAPQPSNPNFQFWIEEAIPRLIVGAKGRTLVLFTSYESLKYSFNAARTYLKGSPFHLLKQGDDDRFRLLEVFKKDTSSVLFATDSFWEGVDVPGESLSQVIIVKLPFAVPNDPVFEARGEAIKKKGRSDFMELSVPHAVIKFRQGFGRLIRHSNDKGVLVVFDKRLVESSYGKQFTTSVPHTRKMYGTLDQTILTVENFLTV